MVQKVGINFVVAPDYLPDHFSHWYLLSSHLQRETEFSIHLHLPANAEEIQELAEGGKMDMLYANAFDAVALIKTGPNPDIRCLGLRLLKQAGLDAEQLKIEEAATFPQAASALIRGQAQAGFFPASTYAHMSKRTLEQLRVLQESSFAAVTHMVVLHPDFAEQQEALRQAFAEMADKPTGKTTLEALDLPAGFAPLTQEAAEQMVADAENGKQED